MNLSMFLLPLAVVALLFVPFIPMLRGATTGRKMKRSLLINLCSFFGICALGIILPIGGFVGAEELPAAAATAVDGTSAGLGYIAAALATGLSALGAGIAVAAAAPAAIGAFSEDSKNFGKSLIFVVLGEGVAIYGLLISILIINKLG